MTAFALGLLGAAAGDAFAQAAPPSAAADSEIKDDPAVDGAAKVRFAEGVKLYAAKKFEAARVAFLQAYLLKKQPATQLALAQASLRASHAAEAVRLFQQYLAENPAPPAKVRARIDTSLAEARQQLAHVTIVSPAGAEVFVDDVSVGTTPLAAPLDVSPGSHAVKVVLGEDSTAQSISLGAGGSIAVVLEPKPKPKGPPPPAKLKAPTPITASEETSGLLSPPKTTWPMYLSGAIGLIGIGTAVVFGSLELNSDKGAQVGRDALTAGGQTPARCNQPTVGTQFDDACAAIGRYQRQSESQHRAFTVALGVGAGGVGIAALWYLFAPKENAHETIVVPNASPDGAGATFVGTF